MMLQNLEQGFPTWGTCTPRGTFAYLKALVHLRLGIEGRNAIMYYLFANICTHIS